MSAEVKFSKCSCGMEFPQTKLDYGYIFLCSRCLARNVREREATIEKLKEEQKK